MKQKSIAFKLVLLLILMLVVIDTKGSIAQGFEVEADPLAYLLKGWSIHTGYSIESWRFSLGTFGIDLPESIHGNEGFDSYMKGAGVSSDFFFSRYTEGLFIGANTGFMHFKIKNTDDGATATLIAYNPGLRVGYRWNTGLGRLYVTPWFSLNYILNAKTLNVGNSTYTMNTWQPFPTVHIGWRF
jgi:hypothetical protein